jgi:DNA replication protein DnaC
MPKRTISCKRCGAVFEVEEVVFYRFRFPAATLCTSCRAISDAEEDERRAERLFEKANVPRAYGHCSFSNFVEQAGTRHAVHRIREWSEALRRRGRPTRGLLIHGPVGAGKTHLAAALLREVIYSKFLRSLFINVPSWLNELRDGRDHFNAALDVSRLSEFLVIDDIGLSELTPWARQHIYAVVNDRDANNRLTIATSNLPPSDLDDCIGRAAASRLLHLCEPVEIATSTDFRGQRVA